MSFFTRRYFLRIVLARGLFSFTFLIYNAYDILVENRLDGVASYKQQAQHDVAAEFDDYRYGKTGQLIIVTTQKTVVKHEPMTPGQPCDIDQISTMVANQSGAMEFDYFGQRRFFSYKVFPQWHWLVILSVTSEEMLAARNQFVGQVAVILLVSLILGSLVFVWFIRRVVGPIRQLAGATAYVSEGKWDAPLPQPAGSDEVAQLTVAFRRMARRLAEMYGNLKSNLQQIEQSQIALRESEEKYRGLVELLPLVVFETDAQGRLVFANRNAFDTFGYAEADLSQGIFLQDVTIDADNERIKNDMARILNGNALGMMEYTGRRKDKSTFPGMVLATPIFQQDEPVGMRGIFIDISERKTLENELRQAREFLDTILNNVADPVFVVDDQHRFILLNDAYCRFLGYSREEVIGKTDRDFFSIQEADGFWEQDDLVFASQQPHEKEAVVTPASGKQQVVLIKKAFFKDAQGKGLLVGTIRDITQRKKMEMELFKARKLKSIGLLAGGIAHDFNNILTAVIGNLSLAKILADPESKIHRRIEASEKASLQAKDLTQQLLTFSRGGAPVKQTVSLSRLIEESVTFTLRGSNVRCELDIAADLWPVEADEGQISRVVHNMMVNASQAMPSGGIVHVSAENLIIQTPTPLPLNAGSYVRLLVKDHGVGISSELLTDIFDPYFTTKEEGSGLGLATAFSIIKRHDGHIGVESTPGEGATFSIYLPASAEGVIPEPEATANLYRGQGKILVMDDEAFVREVVSEMIETLGYACDTATDGKQALEKYQKASDNGQSFDLVIMDLTVPGGMGGKETIKKLLGKNPDAKAIVASGYSSDPLMANHKAHGFLGMITKPFEIEKLSQVLQQALKDTNDKT